MKLTICASMDFASDLVLVCYELEEAGHVVALPHGTEELAGKDVPAGQDESLEYKQEYDTIREHYLAIRESDAIVIVNKEKSGIQNYIGGNTFLEIGFAHVLGKPIFLLNPIPDMIYTTEIIAMNPIVINGDFSLIK